MGSRVADQAGGEVDDAAALAQATARLAHGVEAALEVDRDDAIELVIVHFDQRRLLQHTGVVHQHVDTAEGRFRGIEHPPYGSGVGHVGLGGQRAAAGRFDIGRHRGGGAGIAGVIDDHGEAVAGQTTGDRGTDAARGAGDQGDGGDGAGHGFILFG